MDFGITIIGIIFIVICIVPFIIISINKTKKEKRLFKNLAEIAEQYNCQISDYDLWNNSAIGIDESNSMIFHLRRTQEIETVKKINLTEVQECKIMNSNRTVTGMEKTVIIDKLELHFSFRDKMKEEVVFEFYNTKHDSSTLAEELKLIQKWNKLIHNKLSKT